MLDIKIQEFIQTKSQDESQEFNLKTLEKLFQRKKKEIVGKSVREIIGQKAFKNMEPLFEQAFKGESVMSEVFQNYEVAGKKWMKVSLVPHQVEHGIAGFFLLVEDITEFKDIQQAQEEMLTKVREANKEEEKAREDLRRKNDELIRTNNDLDNFIYTASHDLRSPITNLEGLMFLLSTSIAEKLEPREQALLEMMSTTVHRLQKTISYLVELTKFQKELEHAPVEPLRFEEISRDVQEDIYSMMQESNAAIKENFEVQEINYKKSSLRSIMYNLLSNAIKYRNPEIPLEIELKTFIQNKQVVLSVKDNGLGLSPNQQKKLFKMFTRLHKHIEGTGVGLFMVKRIVDNSGGRIEVQSEAGMGTTFNVSFLQNGTLISE